MNEIIPLFTSDYSFRSILTIDAADEIKDNAPVSIVSIAKKYFLNPVFVIENTMTGFLKTIKYFNDINTQFVFGLKLTVVSDITVKNDESLNHESKIVILLNNTQGYYDLIKIYSIAATEGKYYIPRIDWKTLKKLWSKNLSLAIPMYDSFLHVNLLKMGAIVPDFPDDPIFFVENHNLPIDALIQEAIKGFNINKVMQTHSCYYFKNEDIKAYCAYRCILNRSTFHKPQLESFGSRDFSFESYLYRSNRTL